MNGSARSTHAAMVALLAVVGLAACNDDGRTLRPPRADQNASVSTMAPPATEVPAFDTGPAITLPAEPTTTVPVTTSPPATTAPTSATATTTTGAPTTDTALAVTTSWRDGAPIDPRYTCDGANLAPALRWTTPPAATIEIAITMIDEDAPGFVHWAMAGVDPLSTSLGEGQVPEFALLGTNSTGELGYAGPCPPDGETHRYVLTVHFLSAQTELPDGSGGAELLASIQERSLAAATVTGVYSRG